MAPSIEAAIPIRRSLPHGHVTAVLGTVRALGMVRTLGRRAERMRDLAIAAIVARVIDPASKPATARALAPDTAATGLGQVLDLGPVTGHEMLAMLDWLRPRQPWIERSLANRHRKGGTRVLHDVVSSDREGQCCPLAAFGYNRDGKTGRRQINYGRLCAADGGPVAAPVTRIRGRFRMDRVGDRR